MSRLAVLGVVAWLGCTSEQAVLEVSQVTSCDGAWLATAGAACAFAGTCNRVDPADPVCCTDTAYCNNGALVADRACNPDCTGCADDRECAPGAAICTAGHCTPCPSTINCQACPQGWQRLERNGCATCDCAPPSQCNPGPTVPGTTNGCVLPEVCYPGKRCTPGCAPGDDCCANTCSAPGCPGPAPVGCFMPCVNMPCMQCAAESCECMPNGSWFCTPRCVDNEPVNVSCSV
jgi:hypothetical protein